MPRRIRHVNDVRGILYKTVWNMNINIACSSHLVFELRLSTAFPLLKHLGQFVQAGVMEVKDLVLAFSAGDNQLSAGAGLVAEQTNTLS